MKQVLRNLLVFLALVALSTAMVPREKRSKEICSKGTPCLWTVYVPFTRRVDYAMANTCECGPGTSCVMVDDDLAAGAYVHRCVKNE